MCSYIAAPLVCGSAVVPIIGLILLVAVRLPGRAPALAGLLVASPPLVLGAIAIDNACHPSEWPFLEPFCVSLLAFQIFVVAAAIRPALPFAKSPSPTHPEKPPPYGYHIDDRTLDGDSGPTLLFRPDAGNPSADR